MTDAWLRLSQSAVAHVCRAGREQANRALHEREIQGVFCAFVKSCLGIHLHPDALLFNGCRFEQSVEAFASLLALVIQYGIGTRQHADDISKLESWVVLHQRLLQRSLYVDSDMSVNAVPL